MNTTNRITAIFDDCAHAEFAADELRQIGVDESQISVIALQNDVAPQRDKSALTESRALLNVAVALTPVVGPLFVAGKLVSAARKVVGDGNALDSIAVRLVGTDADESVAREFAETGRTLVVVDATDLDENAARAVLFKHGGRDATT